MLNKCWKIKGVKILVSLTANTCDIFLSLSQGFLFIFLYTYGLSMSHDINTPMSPKCYQSLTIWLNYTLSLLTSFI